MIHHISETDVPQFEIYHLSQANRTMVDVRCSYICLTDMPHFGITLRLMKAYCWCVVLCFVDVEQSGLLGASISNKALCVCGIAKLNYNAKHRLHPHFIFQALPVQSQNQQLIRKVTLLCRAKPPDLFPFTRATSCDWPLNTVEVTSPHNSTVFVCGYTAVWRLVPILIALRPAAAIISRSCKDFLLRLWNDKMPISLCSFTKC